MKPRNHKSRRLFRWMASVSLLFIALSSQQACLPGPTSMQVDTITNCGSEQVSQGIIDVGIADTYFMSVGLINNLATLNDPSTFRPETNVIDLRTAKVWFEYPAEFSRLSLGPELLHTQEAPLTVQISGQLKPSLIADFVGQGGAGGGAAAPAGEKVSFYLIPTEVTSIWTQAPELTVTGRTNQDALRQSGASFTVRAHITISGLTRGGQIIATPEFTFPIRVCKGCLDNRKLSNSKQNALCQNAGGGGGTNACAGQDGNCATSGEGN
ncbi:MAG: hypothetical protein EP343_02070 [Deltaproteobacteria bacterium]|nr:MAG: hypothetical protein EP343_02070 [Deltaproteobacteria bacterium]